MLILSIDIGLAKPNAYACFLHNKTYTNLENVGVEEGIYGIEDKLSMTDIIVTEKPYYKRNIKVYGDFWFNIGILDALSKAYGCDLILVRPYDWKNKLKLTAKQKPEDRQKTIESILSLYGWKDRKELTEDEITAILIGHYYITEQKCHQG